jgi:hypothetical protein
MEQQPIKVDLTAKAAALMRLHNAANSAFQQPGMFSPGTPPQPMYGDEAPHLYEYQPGINLVTTPRLGYGVLPFSALRALASASKEIRLNIELIKRQVRGLDWEIVPSRKELGRKAVMVNGVAYEKTTDMQGVYDFFELPDGVNDFDAWLNMLIEELLVTDAVTLYPSMDCDRLILELIDGTTIRPLVDLRGRTPRAPFPAYLQVLHGIPSTHYPADQLLYRPLNTKVYTPYGESPTEWILTAINTAIRKDAQKIGYYTEGNIPGAFGFLPEGWTPEQIEVWTEYFNALVAGDVSRANKIIWLPGGNGATNPVYPFAQNDVDNIEVDKYLMQVACWAYGNNPSEFGLIPGEGLGGKGFMQGTAAQQMRSMVWPITGYLSSFFTLIIRRYLKRPDLKFQWVGLDPTPDQLSMAQVDQIYTGMGAYDMAYVQDRLGVPRQFRPVDKPAQTSFPVSPFPGSPAQFQPNNGITAQPVNPFFTRAVKAELDTWREKVQRAMKKNWPLPDFKSEIIPAELHKSVSDSLRKAENPEAIVAIFENAEGSISDVVNDPSAHLKLTAEGEMQNALALYFDGLRQRVMQSTVE